MLAKTDYEFTKGGGVAISIQPRVAIVRRPSGVLFSLIGVFAIPVSVPRTPVVATGILGGM
jgi:hypothetical protein